MKYRVIITDEALEQAREFLLYIIKQEQTKRPAQRWWKKAQAKIRTLGTFPHRCPHAPENEWSENELRALIVDSCLFIYHVDEENKTVWVVKFRHGSQFSR